jgi:hypothetical protein
MIGDLSEKVRAGLAGTVGKRVVDERSTRRRIAP